MLGVFSGSQSRKMSSMAHVPRVPETREELQRSLEILGCERACLSCYMCWSEKPLLEPQYRWIVFFEPNPQKWDFATRNDTHPGLGGYPRHFLRGAIAAPLSRRGATVGPLTRHPRHATDTFDTHFFEDLNQFGIFPHV